MEPHVFDRIAIEHGKMNGQPCIRGLLLTVHRVLEAIRRYGSREELRADYPELEDGEIRQAATSATAILGDPGLRAMVCWRHERYRTRRLQDRGISSSTGNSPRDEKTDSPRSLPNSFVSRWTSS